MTDLQRDIAGRMGDEGMLQRMAVRREVERRARERALLRAEATRAWGLAPGLVDAAWRKADAQVGG